MDDGSLLEAREVADRVIDNINEVIVGHEQIVKLGVAALLARGHILIQGVPGVGKTMLARSIAKSIGGTFRRIQCTADLLPTDITGVYIFDQKNREFSFRPGPVMSHIVLVDEINRASPKTQSAFLECMEERQMTLDGVTHFMPDPFMVLATQNPTEHGGTFPLPETELDRFLLRLELDYPTPDEEVSILEHQVPAHPIESIEQVADESSIRSAQEATRKVYVDRLVKEYIVSLVNATRQHGEIYLGASPRASLGLMGTTQAWALLEGRNYTLPDDVKAVTPAVLGHRIILSADSRTNSREAGAIDQILESTPVPGASPKSQGSTFSRRRTEEQ